MATASFSLFWDVENSGRYTGVPVLQRPGNDLDSHGAMLDLPRLSDEDGVSYLKRLRSIIPLRAGSDQEGLVHGITRDLGLTEKVGIKVTPIYISGSSWTAPSPHIEVTATELILYSEYLTSSSNTVDQRIDIFSYGDGYLVEDLVSKILTSSYFVAEAGPYMTGKEKSSNLIPGKSAVTVYKERVLGATYFLLEHRDLVEGSFSFTEKEIFEEEVASEALVTQVGQYYIDYPDGSVTCYSTPSGGGTCRYVYRELPWRIHWSPIAVYSLRDLDYREKLFESEAMLDGTTQYGLVTAEGSSVYEQLFSRSNCLWGE